MVNVATQQMMAEESVVRVEPVLEALVPRFLENRRRDINALEGALGDMDFATIQSIGHAMKGTGGGYGFHAITAIGGDLEEAAKLKDPITVQQLIEALTRYLDTVKVVYQGS